MPEIVVKPVSGRGKRHSSGKGQPMLADVARLAGVSTASVSRVLNAPDTVRRETLQRVTAAIDQLGYLPDGAARALASGHQRTIGAVVPTLDNAIFASCINALQRRLAEQNFSLLVASFNYDLHEELRETRALTVHGVAGLMLVGSAHSPELYHLLQNRGLPYVTTWSYSPDSEHPSIGFDNRAVAYRLTDYLLDLGHRRIGLLAGMNRNNDRVSMRIRGVQEAMAQRGLEILPEYFLERPYDIRQGREALRHLWQLPNPPSALICGNDILAMGALFESQALGLHVPAQLSIVGFDDLPISGNLVPALTTVRVPSAAMGRLAADYLVNRLEGLAPSDHTELDADLVVRGTSGLPLATP